MTSSSATQNKTPAVLAFKNCEYNKTEAVALAVRHYKQDAYMRGTYGKDTPEGWKGCSVGCMAKGEHADYPWLFGIDTRIARLSDAIFEGLGDSDYKSFTVELFKSVKTGSDTLLSWYRFQHWLITDAEHGLILSNNHASVKHIGELFSKAANAEVVTQQQWEEAAYAAAAASAAAYAAKRGIPKTDFYKTMQDKLCYFLAGGV